ncbi:MAG TPA: efflux RND transporter periplasmic adaptor subunit [Thermoanaerobaculia bacterium]|nr:efflux RND transporter periplasmic adaptor subunit [Thermoanaerobaculia bacterium]HUM30272.1 efflux RND transporter periplasmic adaptor subunit [Thermoanaerobaculia bacterium]HXK68432.1 efflux RND transporter periplasmic adaptor subunit [Thermoanaerobaculia bacterium]
MTDRIRQGAYVVLVLAISMILAGILIATGKSPEQRSPETPGPLVKTETVQSVDVPLTISGNGTARARHQIQVVPQVSGRVAEVLPAFVSGGFIRSGEVFLTIEPADYDLAVQRAEADLARASVALDMELAEAEVARSEWNFLHPGEEPPSPLVVRDTQVARARADLAAAQAGVETARLNLSRTRMTLPFNGRVLSESVDAGQFLPAGQPIATVYGTDVIEIPVPLENDELAWFSSPLKGNGTMSGGTPCTVATTFAGKRVNWEGRVVRTEGQIDPITRVVHVIVEVTHSLSEGDSPVLLIPGMFVDVSIHGTTMSGVVPIPRHALRADQTVWVVSGNTLQIRKVEAARTDRDFAYISRGLSDGDRIVVSALDVVTDGMVVREAGGPDNGLIDREKNEEETRP